MQGLVRMALYVDLSLDDELDELELVIEALKLGGVGVREVVRLQVQARPAGHDVRHDLHQALLLQRIDHMLVALQVGQAELDLLEVEGGLQL